MRPQGALAEINLHAVQVVGNLARCYEDEPIDSLLVRLDRRASLAACIASLASFGKHFAAVLEHAFHLIVVQERRSVSGFGEYRNAVFGVLGLDVVHFFGGEVAGGGLAGNVSGEKFVITGGKNRELLPIG